MVCSRHSSLGTIMALNVISDESLYKIIYPVKSNVVIIGIGESAFLS
jgi:hypothetical protein